jgi:hypothetical protein
MALMVLGLALLAGSASACPVCATDTGQAVRQGIFDGHFAANVLLMSLPFAIFIGIAVTLYYGFAGRGSSAVPLEADPARSQDGSRSAEES